MELAEFIADSGLQGLWLWKFARTDYLAPARIRAPQLLLLRGATFPAGIATSKPETRNTETPSNLSAARVTSAGPSSRHRRSQAEDVACGKTRRKNKRAGRRAHQRPRGQRPASGSARCPRI